jgi:hypothetical protein
MKLTIIAKIRETRTCSSSPRAASVSIILGWAALGEAVKRWKNSLTKQQIGYNLENTWAMFGK